MKGGLPGYLGVLGGMGPLAGATFAMRLVALTPAPADQQHIPTLLCNDPRIPDRSDARIRGGEDPLPYMLAGLHRLEAAGARMIAIPCNTAHLWYEELAAATSLPILHIIDAVARDLRALGLERGRIGLMGTPATLALGLYQDRLERHGYQCIVPQADEIERYCVAPIRAVKANQVAAALEPVAECVRLLHARGADAVVLGCTELPLALPHDRRAELRVPLTDSIDALARAAIQAYGHAPMQQRAA